MILKQRKGNSEKGFQPLVRDMVVQKMVNYSIEVRIRRKIRRWRFADAPAHVTNRIVIKFEAMRTAVSPAVCASFMRALWNGVPTSRRMASMKSFTQTNCVLNCSKTAADSIEHYCRCPVLRKCLKTCCDHMCINPLESVDDFFGVAKGLSLVSRLACARRLHVALRVLHFARRNGSDHDFSFIASLEFRKCGGTSGSTSSSGD